MASDVTEFLKAWSDGDDAALGRLVPLVYAELHRIASLQLMRERPEHTLQPTALVHEAYLRLVGQNRAQWQNRTQFLAIAARLMRRVLVDHARTVAADKRWAGQTRVELPEAAERPDQGLQFDVDVLALNRALDRLGSFDERQARIVELRYFGGLDLAETAAALGVSLSTVKNDWAMAKAWLFRELGGSA